MIENDKKALTKSDGMVLCRVLDKNVKKIQKYIRKYLKIYNKSQIILKK